MEQLQKLISTFEREHSKVEQLEKGTFAWNAQVAVTDSIAEGFKTLAQQNPDLPVRPYLLSQKLSHQIAAIKMIQGLKDFTYNGSLEILLLHSPQGFLQFHILLCFKDLLPFMDGQALKNLIELLGLYLPPSKSSRESTKKFLISSANNRWDFSLIEITDPKQNPNFKKWFFEASQYFYSNLKDPSWVYTITKVEVVVNRKLENQFFECQDNYKSNKIPHQTRIAYHSSNQKALLNIAKTGFLEPNQIKKKDKLDPGYFGNGIYFGLSVDYSTHFGEVYHENQQVLVASVLPGLSYRVAKGGEMLGKACKVGYQSHLSPLENELVLFESTQIFPLYIITYTKSPATKINEEKI